VNDWKAVILGPKDNMRQAIEVLDRMGLGIVLVADDQGRLLGTVTDGDIRRAMIKHHGSDRTLDDVMRKDPTIASLKDDRNKILAKMKERQIHQVPILDQGGRITGIETIHRLLRNNKPDNPVFIMAGGFGKRLRPLTKDKPKPLLNVGSKPILEIILEQFLASGFHNFFVSTHYKAKMIREHFGDGGKWGVSIQYIHEEEPLGTAGALGLLPKDLIDLPIIMMNGDLLTKINFEHLLNYHNEQGGIATMCTRQYHFQVPYGVINIKDCRISNIIEKPVQKFFVNAGIYVVDPLLATSVDGNSFLDMTTLLENQIKKEKQVNMFPLHEYWLDIGHIEEYNRVNMEVDS
jgi:dTDP-glucose pyrophosphorylase/predicted transcriptional regulator